MKDYKRLTQPKSEIEYNDDMYIRLQELEDEIERGTLVKFWILHDELYDIIKKGNDLILRHDIDEYLSKCENESKRQVAIEILKEFERECIISTNFYEYLEKEYGTPIDLKIKKL